MTDNDNIVFKIVTALAAADGVDPTALDYTLAEYVNPDTLADLVAMESGPWEFSFQVPGHDVTITDAGDVLIDGVSQQEERQTSIGDTTNIDGPHPTEQSDSLAVFRSLPGMVYRCRNQRGWPMEVVNEGCQGLTGYAPSAFIDGGVSYGADVIHPADRESVWEIVQRALDDRKPFTLTYRIQTATAEQKRVWEKGTGIFDDGELVALEGFITETTDCKEDEMQFQEV